MDERQWDEEEKHLDATIALARNQLETIQKERSDGRTDLQGAQDDLEEYTTREIRTSFSKGGFEDLVELSEFVHALDSEITTATRKDREIQVVRRMLTTPYFARIDISLAGENEAQRIYIGRATLMNKETLDIFIYDWRSPIASVFYRFGTGAVYYDAPGGTMNAQMLLKRQYEIKKGKLLYFFDSDLRVMDGFLREMLSKPASSTMKTIVETIQRDQDEIIRDMDSDVLIVQGAAGSGKTSIALHRMAYLMYHGLKESLTAGQMIILSPSAVFEKHIASVLPDLGEESVRTLLLENIFADLLGDISFQSKEQFYEQALVDDESHIILEDAAFKGSLAMVEILERYVRELPIEGIRFNDVIYNGQVVAKGKDVQNAIINGRAQTPLATRLKWQAKAVYEQLHIIKQKEKSQMIEAERNVDGHFKEAEAYARMNAIALTEQTKKIVDAFACVDCLVLYQQLFANKERLRALSKDIDLPENIDAICEHTLKTISNGTLSYADAAALAYLHIKIVGCDLFLDIRQVVVDEAQDAEPIHFALLRELCRKARFTILGDMNQTVIKGRDRLLYDKIIKVLGKTNTCLKSMHKSFRNTREIFDFAMQFLPEATDNECFSRSGEKVVVAQFDSSSAMKQAIHTQIPILRNKGYESIALIVKSEKDAQEVYQRLKAQDKLTLITGDYAGEANGLVVLPVYMAKGLEFDAVIILEADEAHYSTQKDRHLLYVAATRALHELFVFYTGKKSPLIVKGGEENGLP